MAQRYLLIAQLAEHNILHECEECFPELNVRENI